MRIFSLVWNGKKWKLRFFFVLGVIDRGTKTWHTRSQYFEKVKKRSMLWPLLSRNCKTKGTSLLLLSIISSTWVYLVAWCLCIVQTQFNVVSLLGVAQSLSCLPHHFCVTAQSCLHYQTLFLNNTSWPNYPHLTLILIHFKWYTSTTLNNNALCFSRI